MVVHQYRISRYREYRSGRKCTVRNQELCLLVVLTEYAGDALHNFHDPTRCVEDGEKVTVLLVNRFDRHADTVFQPECDRSNYGDDVSVDMPLDLGESLIGP